MLDPSPPQPGQNHTHINTSNHAHCEDQSRKMVQRFRNPRNTKSSPSDTQTTQRIDATKAGTFLQQAESQFHRSRSPRRSQSHPPPSDAACRAKPAARGTLGPQPGTRAASDLLKRLRAPTRIRRRARTHKHTGGSGGTRARTDTQRAGVRREERTLSLSACAAAAS